TIAEIQGEIGTTGEEQVELVAGVAGTYAIVIRPAPANAAGAYAIRVSDVRPAGNADRARQEARTLRTRAARLAGTAEFDAARSLLEQALALTEQAAGPDAVETGSVASQLAAIYRHLPDDDKSEALFLRALAIMERSRGPDHPE